MNISANNLAVTEKPGKKCPTITPNTMAIKTCTYKILRYFKGVLFIRLIFGLFNWLWAVGMLFWPVGFKLKLEK